ncbi:MAG: hypothetical protein K0R65_1020 [Crocinitomicaceae bacterium]|jgi:hypothetical protein|nr:hypothetical protein [Crocinitomicaceae bacterium]
MKFKLDVPVPDFYPKISHGQSLVLLGSCFSDDMSARFLQAGFKVLANPFGTIFHPLPLARILENALLNTEDFQVFEDKDTWFSWNASTLFSGSSESEIQARFRNIQLNLRDSIQKASYLFITFGTAWGYELKDEKLLVANCHKQASGRFSKQLSELQTMVAVWEKVIALLWEFNPDLKPVFTVSPVRHIRDGVVENTRSKARLFELISRLENAGAYFPSYEIVTDELRDYRFYKEDLVHPNDQATSYIWEKLQEGFCSPETRMLTAEIEKLRLLQQHRPLTSNEAGLRDFEASREAKIRTFLEKHPEVSW